MSNAVFVSVAGATIAVGAICAYLYYKRRNQIEFATEQIEDELQFEDVVSYLRTLELKQEEDTPFIANCETEEWMKAFAKVKDVTPKEGYKLLLVGVYKNNNEITHGKLIYSKSWSDRLVEVLGDSPLVVLS